VATGAARPVPRGQWLKHAAAKIADFPVSAVIPYYREVLKEAGHRQRRPLKSFRLLEDAECCFRRSDSVPA
jgi:hypothetical protein